MNLPRSSDYYKPKEKKPDDFSLLKRIEELVEEFNRYGYRRITAQLHREGIPVNHKKVLRLMRERGLLGKPRLRGVRTTDSTHGYPAYPNLLPQGPVTAPNRVWVADITYIRIFIGFVYLAVILDLFSRKAIG
jgi:transposase InsO family protein